MRQVQLSREQSLERVQRVGEAVALRGETGGNGGVLGRVLPDELGGEATAVPGAVERESGDRRGFARAAAQQRERDFSIVDSYFMPYGIECDQYSIMGEILDFMTFKNIITGEEICQLTLDCNDMQFDVCINKNDLLGEPKIGRRFKGIIWLQGQLHY